MIKYQTEIKKYREEKFLTQKEFAEIIGVGVVTVIRWEKGYFYPSMKIKKKLYNLFTKK